MKKDLSFQLTWFPGFFVLFQGFLGHKTSGNQNYQLLMQLSGFYYKSAYHPSVLDVSVGQSLSFLSLAISLGKG